MGGGMARAVIKLAADISPAMPLMHKVIKGCSYNPEAHLAAFPIRGMPIIIKANEITIYKAEDEAVAGKIMDWLKDTLNNAIDT